MKSAKLALIRILLAWHTSCIVWVDYFRSIFHLHRRHRYSNYIDFINFQSSIFNCIDSQSTSTSLSSYRYIHSVDFSPTSIPSIFHLLRIFVDFSTTSTFRRFSKKKSSVGQVDRGQQGEKVRRLRQGLRLHARLLHAHEDPRCRLRVHLLREGLLKALAPQGASTFPELGTFGIF